MKENLLDILRCPVCKKTSFHPEGLENDDIEVKKGRVLCNSCNTSYDIDNGIVDFLKDPSIEVKREQKAVDTEEYLWDEKGNRYKIDNSAIERFKKQFLLLPEGDGTCFFKRGGCFQSIAEGSSRFYDTLKSMELKGAEKVLILGDGFGYASYKFVQRGCSAVSLDISRYLLASRLYIRKAYFDRVFSDMHDLPFKDNTFDIIFCSAVLHHSKGLKGIFSEIRRTLKPGGRMFAINESARGVFEKVKPLFDDLNKRGYSDTAYTIPEWVNAAGLSGFKDVKIQFLSLADDYIMRQENKNARVSSLLRAAYFFRKHPQLERAFLFLMRYPRILFRPKSWRMICIK